MAVLPWYSPSCNSAVQVVGFAVPPPYSFDQDGGKARHRTYTKLKKMAEAIGLLVFTRLYRWQCV